MPTPAAGRPDFSAEKVSWLYARPTVTPCRVFEDAWNGLLIADAGSRAVEKICNSPQPQQRLC